jgi:dipeptidyl aminopeptidase/acylaminoacyl peptidase
MTEAFTQARRSQWGGQTMTDLRLGLRHALAEFPINPEKTFAMGYGAFGGWAVHWLQVRQSCTRHRIQLTQGRERTIDGASRGS